MKEVTFPKPVTIGEKEHTAADLIEDLVLTRQAWRNGDGPKHAEIVYSALDKYREAITSGKVKLPDKTYGMLLEQMALDPGTNISPRTANRFYLQIMRSINEATEVDEKQ